MPSTISSTEQPNIEERSGSETARMEIDVNDRDSTDSMAAVPEHLRTKSPMMSHDSVKHTSENRTAESTSLNNKDSDAKIRSPTYALASSHHGSEGQDRSDTTSFQAVLPRNKRVSLDHVERADRASRQRGSKYRDRSRRCSRVLEGTRGRAHAPSRPRDRPSIREERIILCHPQCRRHVGTNETK